MVLRTAKYLLLQGKLVFLPHSLALVEPAVLVHDERRPHVLWGAALTVTAPKRPELLLITADAVRTGKVKGRKKTVKWRFQFDS